MKGTAACGCSAATLLLLLLAPRAHAQQRSVDTLETVKVTVLRSPTDATRAPADVASVDQRDATVARPRFALDEVLGSLAGVQVDDRLNFALGERISVRGIGSRTQFGVRGVRIIVDDIPATLADGQSALSNVDLSSIGGAEIIRGPASALYGNASGGVIVLHSAAAPQVLFAPSITAMAGSDGLRRYAAGGGGTSGRATYLLNADRLDYDGYRRYATARNAHFNSIVTYDWNRVSVKVVANAVQYDARNPGALSDSAQNVDRRQAFANNVAMKTGERGKQNEIGTSGTARLGDGELRVSAYALKRTVDNPIPQTIVIVHRDAGGIRTAYSITEKSNGAVLTAIAGAESDLQRDDRQNYVNSFGNRGARTLDQREHVTSVSPFIQLGATYGRLTLLAAGRYDSFRFEASDHLVTPTNPDDSGIRKMSATTPTIGASVELASFATVYANVSQGFQTPTTTELANQPSGAGGFNPLLQPERTHAREAGVKGRMSHMSYSVTGYDMRIDDELIPFEVPSAPGRQYYRNAGSGRHSGVEAEVTVDPVRYVRLHASYATIDARYVNFAVTSGGVTTSYTGNRVPGVAPEQGSMSIQIGDPSSAFISLDERTQGATPANDANTAHATGYAVTNMRAQGRLGTLTIFGGVSNLFARKYDAAVTVNGFGGRFFEPAALRTIYTGLQAGNAF